jgi:NlpC/P60 family
MKRPLLTWLCYAAAALGIVQAASSQEPVPAVHLLPAKQGREIVAAAREHEQPARGTQDCSHLVHEIYARAGLTYPYASSFDLYTGSPNFARVKNPQPGDLIVWPGHAGIVFDRKEHLFYSLVSTGLDTEDYESPYWKSRGRPRFFRYVVGKSEVLTAAATQPPARRKAARVIEERSEDDVSPTESAAREASERSPVFGPIDPDAQRKAPSVPRSIVIAEGRKQPTREGVAEGISELTNASADALRSGDALRAGAQVIIFDQLHVENVEIKRDHGWAFVQLESRASITADQVDLAKHSEEVRWELHRGKSGWEAVTPAARTFVPRDVAVRGLAARLVELTQSDRGAETSEAVRHEEAELAKTLSALLGEN